MYRSKDCRSWRSGWVEIVVNQPFAIFSSFVVIIEVISSSWDSLLSSSHNCVIICKLPRSTISLHLALSVSRLDQLAFKVDLCWMSNEVFIYRWEHLQPLSPRSLKTFAVHKPVVKHTFDNWLWVIEFNDPANLPMINFRFYALRVSCSCVRDFLVIKRAENFFLFFATIFSARYHNSLFLASPCWQPEHRLQCNRKNKITNKSISKQTRFFICPVDLWSRCADSERDGPIRTLRCEKCP